MSFRGPIVRITDLIMSRFLDILNFHQFRFVVFLSIRYTDILVCLFSPTWTGNFRPPISQ